MSRRPSRPALRKLDGILLLDKPAGLSSNQALQRARHLLRAAKGGHTGSLDPLATGLLPLCFGEATKIAGLLLGARKAYETVAVLGTVTDSDDADGQVLATREVADFDDEQIEAALAPLRGCIAQRAPIYSALKQGGEPLYARARRGENIQAPVREVEVHALELLERMPGGSLRLRVECGSGTYVRSLVRDLGQALGCGAHVTALRRLWVEPFRQPRMLTLEALEQLAVQGEAALDACLLPVEAGLAGFERVEVDADATRRLAQGQVLRELAGAPGHVALFGPGGLVLGVGARDTDGLRPQRLFSWAAALGQGEVAP